MLKQNQDKIEFDLNETLYFESGQEIEEMLSISLDPDIAIQTYDSYIQVRGLIILQGEYNKVSKELSNESSFTNDTINGLIERVVEIDDYQAKFSHRFPVEISVPTERVDNLEDITVTVESFDYDLPDNRQLNIKASVHIHGIKTDIEEKQIKEQEKQVKDETEAKVVASPLDNQLQNENHDGTEMTMEASHKKDESLMSKSVMETQTEQARDEQEETVSMTDVVEETFNPEHAAQDVLNMEQVTDNNITKEKEIIEGNEIDIQLSENAEEKDEEEVEDVLFLTDLFSGEEEEAYTKMKIYITQENDTIESIAKSYDMSTLQLITDNNLTGTNLEVGQLLRIPV